MHWQYPDRHGVHAALPKMLQSEDLHLDFLPMSRTVFPHESALTTLVPFELHELEESHHDKNKQFFTHHLKNTSCRELQEFSQAVCLFGLRYSSLSQSLNNTEQKSSASGLVVGFRASQPVSKSPICHEFGFGLCGLCFGLVLLWFFFVCLGFFVWVFFIYWVFCLGFLVVFFCGGLFGFLFWVFLCLGLFCLGWFFFHFNIFQHAKANEAFSNFHSQCLCFQF